MLILILFAIFTNFQLITCDNDQPLLTQTVYGFLDFTTTIGNTVMVFSPQSSPKLDLKGSAPSVQLNIIETKPLLNNVDDSKNVIKPTKSSVSVSLKAADTKVDAVELKSKEKEKPLDTTTKSKVVTSVATVHSDVNYHEYDLLSRQPLEYAEETYRVINHNKNDNNERQRSATARKGAHGNHPVGLVTKINGTYLKNGAPSIQETSVVGTYISGKYAQILQTASIVNPEKKHRHRSSSSIRILKTAAPLHHTTKASKEIRPQSTAKHNRKHATATTIRQSNSEVSSAAVTPRKSSRHKGKRRHKNSKVSAVVATTSTATTQSIDPSPRRAFKTKTAQLSTMDSGAGGSSQPAFKLNRRPGRWQYKTSPKPKVNIRKQSNVTTNNPPPSFDTELLLPSSEDAQLQNTVPTGKDLDASGSQNGAITNNVNELQPKNLAQTLNVEISTPDNFVNTYYEIATIMSPFIFQAGVVKKTRFITVTSTIEKIINDEPTETYSEYDGPLTENILESSTTTISLDGSIATLSPIHIANISQTPNLETIVESFTKTHTRLKTQLLPFIYDNNNSTTLITLVQTYDYTNLITATKTFSPLDETTYSMNFKDFEGNLDEAGSEINLDLEFADEDNAEKLEEQSRPRHKPNKFLTEQTSPKENIPDLQQLALLSLLNQSPGLPPQHVVTSTRPVVTLETLWESHVVPLVKGTQTLLRTLSKSVGVSEKTEYVTELSTLSPPLLPPATQNPYSINPYFNPLLPIPPQPQMITSSEIHHTTATHTNSKILKLTFGARTAYTTIFSTEVVPTVVTKIVTTALPIQPSAAFPNYFPPPYPPFGYVG